MGSHRRNESFKKREFNFVQRFKADFKAKQLKNLRNFETDERVEKSN